MPQARIGGDGAVLAQGAIAAEVAAVARGDIVDRGGVFALVGPTGVGKTTTTAKLAKRLTDREKKRVLMASLDTQRPAAMEQLAILGQQIGVDTLPIVPGENAVQIAKRAKQQATLGGLRAPARSPLAANVFIV